MFINYFGCVHHLASVEHEIVEPLRHLTMRSFCQSYKQSSHNFLYPSARKNPQLQLLSSQYARVPIPQCNPLRRVLPDRYPVTIFVSTWLRSRSAFSKSLVATASEPNLCCVTRRDTKFPDHWTLQMKPDSGNQSAQGLLSG